MRNSHEALRAACKEMEQLLKSADPLHAFEAAWQEYDRALKVHTDLEELSMFPLLDQVNGSPVNLSHFHDEDKALATAMESALSAAIAVGDAPATTELWEQLKAAFAAWKDFHLTHLSEEEKVMMPLTQKVAPTPEGRCKAVHQYLVSPAMDRSSEEFAHYCGWCVSKLNAHGSGQQPARVAVRVFVRALHSASSAAQWKLLLPVVQSNCSSEIWTEVVDIYHVDSPVGDEHFIDQAAPVADTAADSKSAESAAAVVGSDDEIGAATNSPKGCCVVS